MTDNLDEPQNQKRRSTDRIPFLNGFGEQLKTVASFVNTIAVGPLIIITALGMTTGHIRSPLSDISETLRKHDERMTDKENRQLSVNEDVAKSLAELAIIVKRQDRRIALKECDGVRDPDIKRRCLEI